MEPPYTPGSVLTRTPTLVMDGHPSRPDVAARL